MSTLLRMSPHAVPLAYALLLSAVLFGVVDGLATELFSTDAVCRENHCINPIFPGLEEFPRLEEAAWECQSHASVRNFLKFCQEPVIYQPSLPSPSQGGVTLASLVERQEDAAITTYFYHLEAMGLEAWEHQEPWLPGESDCVKAIHRMVCFTFFPRSEAGCAVGTRTKYIRPCASCCANYVKACNVECCDDSAQCVFQHTYQKPGSNLSLQQTGYVAQAGPSALCTGAAGRGAAPLRVLLFALLVVQVVAGGIGSPLTTLRAFLPGGRLALGVLFAAASVILQGCQQASFDIPTHTVARWRQKIDYIVAFEFIPEGQPPSKARINSCAPNSGAVIQDQCGGHGYCIPFNKSQPLAVTVAGSSPLSFCVCDRDWADPECRTMRKSQLKAWLFSVFFGYLGADQFYLGYPYYGIAKLLTLGGLGVWWVYDVIRIGAGPVYSQQYRVAYDFPHYAFVLSFLLILLMVGFFGAMMSALWSRNRKRYEAMTKMDKFNREAWIAPEVNMGPGVALAGGFKDYSFLNFNSRRPVYQAM